MIKIYNNILPKEFENYIEDWLTSPSFSWHKSGENYTTLFQQHSEEYLNAS
jgi:hypothetical protein